MAKAFYRRFPALLILLLALAVTTGCGGASLITVPSLSNSRDEDSSDSCPTGYVPVPALSGYTSSDFCIAQYEMRALDSATGTLLANGNNGGVALNTADYIPASRPDGIPWVRILQSEAISSCQALGTGYHLATNAEWMSMIRNIEQVAANWSTGSVGSGVMNVGHAHSTVAAGSCPDGSAFTYDGVSFISACDGTDPYVGTGYSASDGWGSGAEQKRTWQLSNGEGVWDIAGNVRERVDFDGSGGTISYTGPGSSAFYEINSASAIDVFSGNTGATNLAVSMLQSVSATLDNTYGIGKIYILTGAQTGKVMTRGSNYTSGNFPGIYAADLDEDATHRSSSAGFRCAYTPN